MTRILIIILAALMLASQGASAQKLKKAFSQLEAGRIEEAQGKFRKAVANKKDFVAANYGMGLVYLNDSNPRKDNKLAYMSLAKAKSTLRDKCRRKEVEYYAKAYHLDTNAITDKISIAVRDIFQKTEQAGTLERYYQFISQYKEAGPYYSTARRRYDSLVAEHQKKIAAEEERHWNLIFANPWVGSAAYDTLLLYEKKYKGTQYIKNRNIDSAIFFAKSRIVACADAEASSRFCVHYSKLRDKGLDWIVADKKTMADWPTSGQLHAWWHIINNHHYRTDHQLYDSISRLYTEYAYLYGPMAMMDGTEPIDADQQRIQDVVFSKYDRMPFGQEYQPRHESFYRYFAKEAAPHELAFVSVQRLMAPHIKARDYTRAANILKEFMPLFPHKKHMMNDLYRLLNGKPAEVSSFRKLPDAINSGHNVGHPVLSPDMTKLYYCVKGYEVPEHRKNPVYYEEIMVCDYDGGRCSNPRPMQQGSPHNLGHPVGISPDGRFMLITCGDRFYGDSVSRTKIVGDSLRGIIKAQPWHTGFEDGACYSSDGSVMLFSSAGPHSAGPGYMSANFLYVMDTIPRVGEECGSPLYYTNSFGRGDTLGNYDIYVMRKESNGKWGYPMNIGGIINTPFYEGSPVLAADMRTLYFVSDGHYSLGGADIYMTKRIHDDSWTQWTPPVNLGLRINTQANDLEFWVASDGKHMILQRENQLYSLELPKHFCADPVHVISGRVRDTKGNPIKKARIVWEDLHNDKMLGSMLASDSLSEFYATLPTGKYYGYTITADGYLPVCSYIDTLRGKTPEIIKDREFVLVSVAQVVRSGDVYELGNIFFAPNGSDLMLSSRPSLRRFSKFVDDTNGAKVEISVYVDHGADGKTAEELSQLRAKAVREYLSKIYPSSNIEVRGMGQGRSRVEFRVVR
ncbi:MAG: OmpA family protein [Bacteroidales bacterium]|nr:OmpA family protein [Bacteroidales bacterium]